MEIPRIRIDPAGLIKSPHTRQTKRGLVASSPFKIVGREISGVSTNFDPQELRSALLLWDRIAWPTTSHIVLSGGPDEDFLEQVGFIWRPHAIVENVRDAVHGFVLGQIAIIEELERQEPGVWTLAQSLESLRQSGAPLVESLNPRLHLTNAIPVPGHDVPLAEVLAFKERRRDQYLRLWEELDRLVYAVSEADDKVPELHKLVASVDAACADAIRVAHEWHLPVRLINFKTTYKLRPFQSLAGAFVGAPVGAALSSALGMSAAALGAISGALIATAPAVECSFDGIEWRGLRPRRGPYQYVCDFHREIF